MYKPSQIIEWVGKDGNDALCPQCGIDAVLSDAMCKLGSKVLKAMNAHWFCHKNSMKFIPDVLKDAE